MSAILQSDATLARFCTSRDVSMVLRELHSPWLSQIEQDRYDRESSRLLTFMRGQQIAAAHTQQMAAA